MFRWKFLKSKWLALGWLILISILFFLPGSALPKNNWFNLIHIDKWVHVGMFAVLLFLWRSAFTPVTRNHNLMLLIIALIYGLLVEFIQLNWVPNRDFDLYDVLADMIGAVLGILCFLQVYKKNKPL